MQWLFRQDRCSVVVGPRDIKDAPLTLRWIPVLTYQAACNNVIAMVLQANLSDGLADNMLSDGLADNMPMLVGLWSSMKQDQAARSGGKRRLLSATATQPQLAAARRMEEMRIHRQRPCRAAGRLERGRLGSQWPSPPILSSRYFGQECR